MKNLYLVFGLLILNSTLWGQDDIYDDPEPYVQPVYSTQNQSRSYEPSTYNNDLGDYNPDFDYRYSRNLRRMYDPYYMMPTSAWMNMYSYPQFASFYNPYWGNSVVISIGNGWNNWGWNNWNSWGWNSWGMNYGWNNWNYGWNFSPYYGYGGMNPWCNSYNYYRHSWGHSNYRHNRSNYIDVNGNRAYSNTRLPNVDRYPRANGRYQHPTNGNSSFRRPQAAPQNSNSTSNFSSPNNSGSTFRSSGNSSNSQSSGGSFRSSGGGSSSQINNSNTNSSRGGGGFSAPSRSGGSRPSGGRF